MSTFTGFDIQLQHILKANPGKHQQWLKQLIFLQSRGKPGLRAQSLSFSQFNLHHCRNFGSEIVDGSSSFFCPFLFLRVSCKYRILFQLKNWISESKISNKSKLFRIFSRSNHYPWQFKEYAQDGCVCMYVCERVYVCELISANTGGECFNNLSMLIQILESWVIAQNSGFFFFLAKMN